MEISFDRLYENIESLIHSLQNPEFLKNEKFKAEKFFRKELPIMEVTEKEIFITKKFEVFQESLVHMADMISMIRGIYESIPDRPTGPLVSPPGAHGETYFVTQAMLWHRGHKWLVHASRTLENTWTTWKNENQNQHPRNIELNIAYIDQCISRLGAYHNI